MSKECLDKMKLLTKYDDWIDNVIDGKPEECSLVQMGTIESLLSHSSYEFEGEIEKLTYIDAEELILKLKENETKTDPRDQYQKMYRDGVFNS